LSKPEENEHPLFGVRRHEHEVREEVEALEDFGFLDGAGSVFADIIDRATEEMKDVEDVRRSAMLYASIRAFRAIRAAQSVISSGYPLEAEPFTRMTLELFVSAQAIVADHSGEEAKQWLAGERARGLAKRTREALPDGKLYGDLSQATHGDPRALPRALMQVSEGRQTIEWGPALTDQTGDQLVRLALTAREFCVLLEEVGFEKRPEVDAIDAGLARRLPGWLPDADWDTSRIA
jgi:hypothetical protein